MYTLNDFNTFETIEDIKVIYDLTTKQAFVIYELSAGNLKLMKAIASDWNDTGLDFDEYIDEGVFYKIIKTFKQD